VRTIEELLEFCVMFTLLCVYFCVLCSFDCVLFCVMCVVCVLCLMVVPLPLGKNPFAVKVNNNNIMQGM
jgi:hypothetical protein